MTRLVLRGLAYYWRTNIAVVLGVATAVAVLGGALLVGDSVRGSLRDLVVQRLGRTDLVVASAGYFREQLAADIEAAESFGSRFTRIAPLVVTQGVVTAQESGRRVGRVRVYGVDDRFWRFHGIDGVAAPTEGNALVSPALAAEIGVSAGTTVLVRVQRPSDIPLESLHARKDDLGRTMRLAVREIVPAASLGEFALDPQQGDVRAVFVPLSDLQREIEVGARVNTLLVSAQPAAADAVASLEQLVKAEATLEDVGMRLRALNRAVVVESDAGLLTDEQIKAVETALAGERAGITRVFTYVANTLRHGDREVPYSLVTATDSAMTVIPGVRPPDTDRLMGSDPIVLSEWTANELSARAGDLVSMEYYVWEEPGQLVTRTSEFRVLNVVPTDFGDPDLAPMLPGISNSITLSEWDPPFPIDLRRIRRIDEQYWERYRTTPKAFVSLETGQRLWRSKYGSLTSVRIAVPPRDPPTEARERYAGRLRAAIDPPVMGLAVRDVRAQSLEASRGATDFGAYFVYFSFFLVVSALLLAALFFKLGIEQRAKEVGLLRAVGFDDAAVRRVFLGEGVVLAVIGSVLGVFGAVGYAALMMAVGTRALTLHVSNLSLAAGALGGIVAGTACIWWTLRGLSRVSERALLTGQIDNSQLPKSQLPNRSRIAAAAFALIGLTLIAGGAVGIIARTGAFFAGGTALLIACLCLFAALFRLPPRHALGGHGWRPVSRLGLRNATYRPGRSVLSMAVIASATFILISVDAFRRGETAPTLDRRSGVGGYTLIVETLLPVVHDPNTREGRDALSLFDLQNVTFEPFRLLPGDDASCLNLYEPVNPRILAPRDSFLEAGRFVFQDSLAASEADAANPWLLLNRTEPDGAVPVIADANSMTYVLHRALGEDIVITRGGREIRLRLVAALRDSIFQGELLMSQANFTRLFPEQEGYQVLLVEAPLDQAGAVSASVEDALVDFGADATGTAERLAQFHRVENTYLSTFQTLGGLGLLLGTLGLAAVLFRNVLERRQELALLAAVGYRRGHFLLMVAAENALLLAGGLAAGAVCAGLAIAPAVVERGGTIPLTSSGALLLFAVFVTGLLSSIIAVRLATRAPVLEALRSE
jgi:putative ABC transport system permease protein